MDPAAFNESPAGQLIRVNVPPEPYWAFVPHPLPPGFAYDHQLVGKLSRADRALAELAGLGRIVTNPNLLIRPFMKREAVLSSRIEGTQAEIADLYAYEAGQLSIPGLKPPAPEADVREVLNYVEALDYGLERLADWPISLRLIKEIHAQLMRGVRGGYAIPGEFRRSQNWIGAPGCTLRLATYVPPPVPEMNDALGALELYIHRDEEIPPLLRLAFIHYQFEAIHPFIDGNGRMGRLLMILLLVHWGLLPMPLLYLSAYFERHRDAYYAHLLAVSQQGAWRAWLAFFLDGVAEQAADAVARAKELSALQLDWRRRLAQARASALTLRLADALFETPILSIPQAERLLGATYRGAKLNVDKLVDFGILSPAGPSQGGKLFIARDILRITQ